MDTSSEDRSVELDFPPEAYTYPPIRDFQFFPKELHEILTKEKHFQLKELGYKIPVSSPISADLVEALKEAQKRIDEAKELTAEEMERKRELFDQGFLQWTEVDFNKFIVAVTKYGRYNTEKIIDAFPNHDAQYVVRYIETFWERCHELHNYYEVMERFTDPKILGKNGVQKLLNWKMDQSASPINQLKIVYPAGENDGYFNEDQDRFLLCMLHYFNTKHKDAYTALHIVVSGSPMFATGCYTLHHIQTRCEKLMKYIRSELDEYSLFRKAADQD